MPKLSLQTVLLGREVATLIPKRQATLQIPAFTPCFTPATLFSSPGGGFRARAREITQETMNSLLKLITITISLVLVTKLT